MFYSFGLCLEIISREAMFENISARLRRSKDFGIHCNRNITCISTLSSYILFYRNVDYIHVFFFFCCLGQCLTTCKDNATCYQVPKSFFLACYLSIYLYLSCISLYPSVTLYQFYLFIHRYISYHFLRAYPK